MSRVVSSQFTPRTSPRPQYEPAIDVLKSFVWSKVQAPSVATILCYALERPHRRAKNLFHALGDFQIPINPNSGIIVHVKNDDRLWYCVVGCVIHMVLYWAINSILLYIDVNGYLRHFKLDRKGPKQTQIDWTLLKKTWTEALFGQFVVGPLGFYFLIYPCAKYFGMPSSDTALEPNFFKLYLQFVGCTIFNEFYFYWAHRILHHKALYRHIHKQHHEYVATIGFAAEYSHPIEQVFSNYIPSIGACVFFGYHPLVFFFWLAWRLQETYEAHSGYAFIGNFWHRVGLTNGSACAYHDHHHMKNQGNFSSSYLDWIFGTQDAWARDGGEKGYIAIKKLGQRPKLK